MSSRIGDKYTDLSVDSKDMFIETSACTMYIQVMSITVLFFPPHSNEELVFCPLLNVVYKF